MVKIGMDSYIFRARTKKAFKEDNWYESEQVTEVWYARKFWSLVESMPFIKEINKDCGEYIRLTKNDIEKMIEHATHNPDYWGGFDSVPALCKILQAFDDDEENGWHYYFEFDF